MNVFYAIYFYLITLHIIVSDRYISPCALSCALLSWNIFFAFSGVKNNLQPIFAGTVLTRFFFHGFFHLWQKLTYAGQYTNNSFSIQCRNKVSMDNNGNYVYVGWSWLPIRYIIYYLRDALKSFHISL